MKTESVGIRECKTRLRLVRVEQEACVGEQVPVYGPKDAAGLVGELLEHADREHFVVLHLNGRHHVVSTEVVSVGTLTQVSVHPREVFKGALLANAKSIICAHNHPSGDLTPSRADRQTFDSLKAAGELLGVSMLDFLIVAGDESWAASQHWL